MAYFRMNTLARALLSSGSILQLPELRHGLIQPGCCLIRFPRLTLKVGMADKVVKVAKAVGAVAIPAMTVTQMMMGTRMVIPIMAEADLRAPEADRQEMPVVRAKVKADPTRTPKVADRNMARQRATAAASRPGHRRAFQRSNWAD